jgi:hypothetical protein
VAIISFADISAKHRERSRGTGDRTRYCARILNNSRHVPEEFLSSSRIAFLCLWLVASMMGQSKAPMPQLKPRPAESATAGASNLPPDTPVITIQGLCEKPAGSSATPSDCKTVITRAEFEKVLNVAAPNLPKNQLKQFAGRYVVALVVAEKAHEQGLDQSPEFQELMTLQRLQVLDRLASDQMQREAAKVTDNEIEEFYRQHQADFKTVSYDKLYVPKEKQFEGPPADPDLQKKRQASESDMKEEADKLRARAAAGEDFTKLQQDAYDFAGFKAKASNTHVNGISKTAVPSTEAAIFDLKKGEVSQVLSTGQGFMIYKVDDVQDRPLADVRSEIARRLQGEKMKAVSEQLQKSASESTTFDEAYFATPAPPTLLNPGEVPSAPNPSSNAAPGKK